MADVRELSTDPAVKLSGAAAVTTDNATVVAFSPNSNSVSVVSQPELVTTGTITTTDIVVAAPTGNGALLTGTPTAGSYVAALATGGNASVVIGITGLTSGTLYYEGSADSTTGVDGGWVSLNMRQAGIVNTQISSAATASGLYRGNTAGIRYIRMRSVGALTGTPVITLRLSAGVAGEFLFGSIPSGTNTIGASNINTANASATTALHTANATVGLVVGANLPITGFGTSVIKVTGTFVASMAFKVSQDAGATWDSISGTQVGGGDIFTVATLPGSYRFTVTGFDLLRVEVTLTSGSITINGKSSNAVNASKIVKLATSGLSIGIVQTTTPTAFSLSSAATTNATSVKATAGTVFQVTASNVGAAAAFLKLFNLATAPTVGTSVPFLTLPIPATGILNIPLGTLGMRFGTGIAFSVTNLIADADATVIAAAQVKVAIAYL